MTYVLLLKKNGFTVVELLITIGILAVLAALAAPIYGNWQAVTGSEVAIYEIKSALELAQSESYSGLNDTAHGVYFDSDENGSDSYILYEGTDFLSRISGQDDRRELNSELVLATDIPGQDINFSLGLAQPSATGTITLFDTRTKQTHIISINELGVIGFENQ